MNKNMILRAIMLVLASHLLALHLHAALPTSGEWPATTITADETVNLTGDVSVSGTITINNGIKLTINNNTGSTIRITPTATMDNLFSVNVGGELVINGNASGSSTINYNGIIIDGGASLTWNNYQLNGTTSFIRHAIYSLGNFDIKNVTIQNIYRDSPNNALACNGILSDDGDWASISHCEFKYIRGFEGSAVLCRNANSGGSTLDISDSHFVYCCTYDRLGSTIRSFGTSSTTLSMKNCCVEYCNSNGGHGGAVYWNAHGRTDTCCKFDGCRFLNNRATLFGGGLFIETSVFFINNKTTIQGNIAYGSGGGICINGYTPGGAGNLFSKIEATINDKLEIIGNSAPNGRGGGFYCCYANTALAADNATITYNIDGAVIKDNKAGYGGGIYFLDDIPAEKNVVFTVNLNYGDVTGNTATNDGGGIYLKGINIGNSSSGGKTCNVSGDTAKNGGGIFIENGNLKLDKVDISKNTATESGGGVCIDGGTFAINSGTISQNSCTKYGGGVYSSYSGSDYIGSSLSGGTVNANTALAGGGICVDGKINFTTSATNIEGNKAINGGGICVMNGAKMLYKSGLIRNNIAQTTTDMMGQTAYLKDVTEVSGIGGGVFVANNASLSFDVTDRLFGLYGNIASNGADDIFANGNSTSISLPDVSDMNLTGYDLNLPANSLYWVEDYITDDANYTLGTNIMGANYPGSLAYKNWRYRYALDNDDYGFYLVNGNQTLNCYTSLALGFHLVYITVVKSGMKDGYTAMFQIKPEGASKDYISFLLKDSDKKVAADGTVTWQKRIRLFSGTWSVSEVDSWSWAYDAVGSTSYTRTLNASSPAEDLIFRFSNKPKSSIPKHDEDVKVNTISL